jgi:hypothetical protein
LGWSKEAAATIPKRYNARHEKYFVEVDGKRMLLAHWARQNGISISTLRTRIKNGWTLEDIVKIPIRRKPEPIKVDDRDPELVIGFGGLINKGEQNG